MVYRAFVDLVGSVPAGLEDIVYIFSCVCALWLLLCGFTLIGSIFKRIMDI